VDDRHVRVGEGVAKGGVEGGVVAVPTASNAKMPRRRRRIGKRGGVGVGRNPVTPADRDGDKKK